jgi:hypothetical protein
MNACGHAVPPEGVGGVKLQDDAMNWSLGWPVQPWSMPSQVVFITPFGIGGHDAAPPVGGHTIIPLHVAVGMPIMGLPHASPLKTTG